MLLLTSAMVTQAFERQAVLLLQGEWPTTGLVGAIRRRQVRRHRNGLDRLRKKYERINTRIWDQVASRVPLDDAAWHDVPYDEGRRREALKVFVLDQSRGGMPKDLRQVAASFDWEPFCEDPDLLTIRTSLNTRFNKFSVPRDMRPTRLGNFIASLYYDLADAGVSDPDFVLHNYDKIQPRLVRNHNEAMSRLDMYSSTVCICLGLAVTAPILLVSVGTGGGAV